MFVEYWIVLFSSWIFAVMLGLNISDGFKTSVTIYIIIPFLIIPQIVLSGIIVRYENLNPEIVVPNKIPWFGEIITARWAYEALAVDQFVAGESHRDALVDLLVGILDETELLVDLVDEFPGLFEFSLKFVGVDIDCLHALLLKKICRHCNKIFVLGYNNGKHEKKEDAMPQKATDAPQADKDVEALRKEIETLKKDLLKLTETLGKIGEEKIRSSVDEVKEKVVSQIPKEQLEQLEAVKAQGEEAIEMIKQQQKEHPVGTLLVAAGIGFLLGKVLGGKSG